MVFFGGICKIFIWTIPQLEIRNFNLSMIFLCFTTFYPDICCFVLLIFNLYSIFCFKCGLRLVSCNECACNHEISTVHRSYLHDN